MRDMNYIHISMILGIGNRPYVDMHGRIPFVGLENKATKSKQRRKLAARVVQIDRNCYGVARLRHQAHFVR